jgi:hypothetical protein
LFTLTLKDEKIHFDGEDELSENDHILKYLIDNFSYMTPQDQDLYLYVNDVDDA